MEFSIEKAQALLDYIKEVADEDSTLLEMVRIEIDSDEHPMFGYQPINKTIYMTTEPLEGPQDKKIIEYMNKEFGLNLKNIALVRYIHAFLHELGHHLDIGNCNMVELQEYMGKYFEYDFEIKERTMINTEYMCDLIDNMEDAIEKIKEDKIGFSKFFSLMDKMVPMYLELRKERINIDDDYRKNPAEYAADAFAAKILDKYLRKSMPELFEPQEHVIRKLEK